MSSSPNGGGRAGWLAAITTTNEAVALLWRGESACLPACLALRPAGRPTVGSLLHISAVISWCDFDKRSEEKWGATDGRTDRQTARGVVGTLQTYAQSNGRQYELHSCTIGWKIYEGTLL